MHPSVRLLLPLVGAAALLNPGAAAQTPTVLLRSGDTVDWQGQARVVDVPIDPRVSQFGCRGVSLLLGPVGSTEVVYWGTCDRGAPRVLRGAQLIGGVQQTSIDASQWGFDPDGAVIYHANALGTERGIWSDDTLLVRPGDPVPGTTNRFFSNPGRFGLIPSALGPVFTSGIRDAAGNNTGLGLFQGAPPVRLVSGEDTIPGLTVPLSTHPFSTVDLWRYVGVSPDGSHWCASVDLGIAGSALVVDGVAGTVDGLPVQTGQPVPASVASQGTWNGVGDVSVNDSGSWTAIVTYEVNGQLDAAIVRDGQVVVATGSTVPGLGTVTSFRWTRSSRNGRLAYIASVSGSIHRHLVVDGRRVLSEGDEVDYDGDGIVDPGYVLDQLDGNSTGTEVDDDGTVWTSCRISLPGGGTSFALLEVPGYGLGTSFCAPAIPNSSGGPARLGASGHAVAGGLPLGIRATGLPLGSYGILLTSPTTAITPMARGSKGTLCLGDGVRAFSAQVARANASGAFEFSVDTLALPGAPSVAIQPGETWTFQAWFRDPHQGGTTNFTDAVQVTFD